MFFCKLFYHFSLDSLTLTDWYWLPTSSSFLTFADFLFLCLEVVICRYFEPFLFLLDELPLWIINRSSLEGEWFSWTDLTSRNGLNCLRVSKRLGPPKKPKSCASSKLHLFLRGILKCREFLRHIHITIGDFFLQNHTIFGVFLESTYSTKSREKRNVMWLWTFYPKFHKHMRRWKPWSSRLSESSRWVGELGVSQRGKRH